MRYIRESQSARPGAARLLWAFVFSCVLLVGGCGTRTAKVGDPGDLVGQDEMFHYVPKDDGIPLSSTELAVLNSTGELDGKLPGDAMDDITIQYKYFLHKARPTFERFLRRAEAYLPYVKQVLRERGLPEDLAYIAFIESGYSPFVVSRAGAAGTWQFMPLTGQKYGLAQDWWMDERHDTFKATRAAADYLAKLYNDFKDWHLAIAAYNAGEGKIGRALEGTGAKTFFELVRKNGMLDERGQLKDETKQYVPRFLAVCKMMRNLEKLGFAPPDPRAATTLTKLDARPGTDLLAVAQAVDMDWTEFSTHNPAYKRHVSPTDRGSALYVPGQARDKAQACIDDARTQRGGGWKSYTAVKNDTWQRISANSGVPVGVLKTVNNNKNLKAGVSVRIPGGGISPAAAQIARATPASVKKKEGVPAVLVGRQGAEAPIRPAAPPEKGARTAKAEIAPAPKAEARQAAPAESFYVVKAGDTVYSIARSHGTDVESVLRANRLAAPQQLRAGQTLRIAGVRPPAPAAGGAGNAGTHRVQAGDTVYSIARKYNVPPQDLMRANKMNEATMLRPGDTIRVGLN
ncbi:MAG: LysM peptidoglycan-binding domain-containing protein [Deltaproteobacteria bacterium]|jgi:membrane-bound lytic murein transglycosylase D|nr:LysM peptidoglycan-binding domain-containing protein [Deltaproteobacteria bacterium]